MRAGTLSNPQMAALFRERFVCAWEKKGAVEVMRVKGKPSMVRKLGGNILSYVCTPGGRVIHAIQQLRVLLRQEVPQPGDFFSRETGQDSHARCIGRTAANAKLGARDFDKSRFCNFSNFLPGDACKQQNSRDWAKDQPECCSDCFLIVFHY